MTTSPIGQLSKRPASLLSSCLAGERQWHSGSSHRRIKTTTKRVTRTQLLHLVRRVLVLAVATFYVFVSIQSVVLSALVLKGTTSSLETHSSIEASLIPHYAGKATIRESELLRALKDVTTPRNHSLFLESRTSTSFSGCAMLGFNRKLYSNAFMRTNFAGIKYGAYNLTFLENHELILPVIDCSSPLVVYNDVTAVRVYYLTRLKTNPDDVFIMTVSFSLQNYAVPDQHQEGAVSMASFSFLNDMRATTLTHHFALSLGFPYTKTPVFEIYQLLEKAPDGQWIMRSIPAMPLLEAPKTVITVRREGFFIKSEREQANFRNLHWRLFDDDPVHALSTWEWQERSVMRDSWAWVHYIHLFFAFNTLLNHCVLLLVIYRNARVGKIWVGDAFASIANALLYRGVFVLFSWQVSGFWSISGLCFARAYEQADLEQITIHTGIIHADLLTVFLASVGVLGFVTKERIDPAFAVILYEITLQGRLDRYFLDSATEKYLATYALEDFERGLVQIGDLLASKSPMRLWTIHRLTDVSVRFFTASTGPNFCISMSLMVLFVVVRKLHRHHHPERLYSHKTTPKYKDPADNVAEKQTLTLFEVATGAELQNKFGILSDYDTYVFFKGLKFASADGIYCNGFVIANGEYLVATEDILVIVLMKLTRLRFRNVYIYEVDGSKLQQTARIVYPDTLSWTQLLHLNVDILA